MLLTPPDSPTLHGVREPCERLGHLLANRIQLTEVLGVGAYGVVYKAVDIHSSVPYAVKALNKIGLDARQRKFQEREIRLHCEASQHPNVVTVVKVIHSPDCTFVILEYCPDGDLFINITEKGQFVGHDLLAKSAFLQILDAVQYCHALGVYHRDLKPENVLVTDNGMTVKLADFGLATTDCLSSDFGCGSTFYMSPECQQPSPKAYSCYSSAANDIWSLGVILVNLTCGRNPWKRASVDDATFKAFLRDPGFLRSILPLTPELEYILQRVFDCDPSRRITLHELRDLILRCPVFTTQASLMPGQSKDQTTPVMYEPYISNLDQLVPASAPQALVYPESCSQSPLVGSLIPQFSQLSTGNASLGSDCSSVFSASPSPTSSSSSRSSYTAELPPCSQDFTPASPTSQSSQSVTSHYVSPIPTAWYANFMPALDLAQKHVSFQPFFPNVRIF
ncbi:MAG: hypothetical protein M1828_001837 [Chrysothrix sp. TS-e1954]|nr:MAG: hypothetical protein M1828_001837 [Chrysothrix sp. TS-e1954]